MCTQIITEIIKYCIGCTRSSIEDINDNDNDAVIRRSNINRAFSNLDTIERLRPYERVWLDNEDITKDPSFNVILSAVSCDAIDQISKDLDTIFEAQPLAKFYSLANGLNNMKLTYPEHTEQLTKIISQIYSKD